MSTRWLLLQTFTTESHVALTRHFIQNQDLDTTVLQTDSIAESHIVKNIEDHLKATAEERGVLVKVCDVYL